MTARSRILGIFPSSGSTAHRCIGGIKSALSVPGISLQTTQVVDRDREDQVMVRRGGGADIDRARGFKGARRLDRVGRAVN